MNTLNSLSFDRDMNITGLRGSSVALLAAQAAAATRRPVLCITAGERQAELLEQDLAFFTGQPVIRYPGYNIPPYTPLSPDPATVAARLSALYQVLTATEPVILVASCEALLRRVMPRPRLAGLAELVIAGEETDQEELARRLLAAGYEPAALVQTVGDFSVRGGIVDVFPPGFANPVRLDFFGDAVESIRAFDPISQRSIEALPEVVLLPAGNILYPQPDSPEAAAFAERCGQPAAGRNWQGEKCDVLLEMLDRRQRFPGMDFLLPLFYPSLSTPFDYLAANTLVLEVDPVEIGRSIRLIWERIDANFAEALATKTPALAPEALFLPAAGLTQALTRHTRLRLYDIPDADLADSATVELAIQDHMLLKQEITLARPQQGLLAPLADRVSAWLTAGDRVVMACRSPRHVRHLAELLEQHRIPLAVRPAPLKPEELRGPAVAELLLYDQPLAEGFELIAERCHILSESELFGEKRLGLKKSSRPRLQPPDQPPMRFDELNSGDIVVHREHGLGVYQGLVTLELQGITNDFLQITYLGEDKLYVPVDRINTVGKYQGLTDKQPKIDRLGGSSWALAKKKVKEAVWQVAQELLELYAKRELRQGRAFSPPAEMFRELEESFPFEETPGQHKAIQEVLDDLISEKPTDRLVCGDVGYGKTEVAVRAAFKVVEDGLQVAVLVPTTVLAEQHAATFRERLQGFPVQVESINRFRSPAEQRRILQELANGTIDIIIGTHRLLSKDIAFKKLGLLVVDEEHRFGVTHKEKIKKLRNEVDILTLSATPIPRTLQMSLLGIRDLSVISTPPEHRRKILTFVARYDDLVIKEAIIRELQRGGQTFLVHNRVQTIYRMAERVTELVPDARVAVAHGQMPGKALEEIMVRFVKKELDVLVCTTIIESGLDITNANTIIINRADRLGLAEIYQLRGRVGRSSEQSYAYLLVPSMDDLSKDAKDRLRALMDCSDLGGGFKLALSDLQIRGGGNLLGVSQSGHITAVGYELYLDLLQKTVMDLKRRAANAEAEREEIEPEINLRLSAFIPAGYINDSGQRYIAYRKIAALATDKEIADLQDELRDRYGALPAETLNLFEIMAVKMTLKRLLITRLEQGKETLVFSFHAQTPVSPQRILELLQKSRETMRFTPDARLVVPLRHPAISPLTVARDLLAALA